MRRFTVCMVLALGVASADATPVTITGGQDVQNRFLWRWAVTNNGESPIVSMQFPHFRAKSLFYPKHGWTEEVTHRTGLGAKEENGVFILRTDDPSAAVQPGGTIEIGLEVGRRGAHGVPCAVVVTLADGRTIEIPRVDCPQQQAVLARNAKLIGLAAMFGVFVLYRYAKGRRSRITGTSTTSGGAAQPSGPPR